MSRSPARLPDWLFSAPIKRRLFHVLFVVEPDREWSELELARRVGSGKNGSIDEHLQALCQLGLLEQIGRRQYRVKLTDELQPPLQEIRSALATIAAALQLVPDEPVRRPQ